MQVGPQPSYGSELPATTSWRGWNPEHSPNPSCSHSVQCQARVLTTHHLLYSTVECPGAHALPFTAMQGTAAVTPDLVLLLLPQVCCEQPHILLSPPPRIAALLQQRLTMPELRPRPAISLQPVDPRHMKRNRAGSPSDSGPPAVAQNGWLGPAGLRAVGSAGSDVPPWEATSAAGAGPLHLHAQQSSATAANPWHDVQLAVQPRGSLGSLPGVLSTGSRAQVVTMVLSHAAQAQVEQTAATRYPAAAPSPAG